MSATKLKMNGHANGDLSVKMNGDVRKVNGTETVNKCQLNGNKGMNGSKVEEEKVDPQWSEKFLPPPLVLDDMDRARKVEACLDCLRLDGADLLRVRRVFREELLRGLKGEPSSLQMENTYVPELPDGSEEGVFLALDLGGTNFRVLLLELHNGELTREDVRQYHISDCLRLGPGEDLFNFLADCVLDFVRREGIEHEALPLGFTFSFPMRQHSISSGELITWTKSFNCGGMQGVDVAALLQRCLRERGLSVTVQVLLNDTTGTLVSGAWHRHDVGIGVILGTGSNGCYVEKGRNVSWEGGESAKDVVVDIEWGAFGDNGTLDFIRTPHDEDVDQNSLLVNSFTFEKYIGGKYLGALAQSALRVLNEEGLMPSAPQRHQLHTADLSLLEEEQEEGGTSRSLTLLASRGMGILTKDDARVAQHVSRLVTTRAAHLAAVCIAELISRMGRGHVAVAVDGSVFKCHPRIQDHMERAISLLVPQYKFTLVGAEDGSGKGSALTAAIAARIALQHAST